MFLDLVKKQSQHKNSENRSCAQVYYDAYLDKVKNLKFPYDWLVCVPRDVILAACENINIRNNDDFLGVPPRVSFDDYDTQAGDGYSQLIVWVSFI